MTLIPWLTLLTFTPLLGALLLALPLFSASAAAGEEGEHGHGATPPEPPATFFARGGRARTFALVVTLLEAVFGVMLAAGFRTGETQYQFVEKAEWIPTFGVSYTMGIDGLSLLLILLTVLLMPLVVLESASVKHSLRGYLASMLVLQTAMLGTLVSLDLFLFYIFWELMLAPMYFIIGLWGGERRIYATLKFFLYTVAGSLLMLAALLYLVWQYYVQQNGITFYLPDLIQYTNLTLRQELWLFLAFALAFGIKVPLVPFHTWLPDAHVEAPTGGSVVLAGVLLKMGLYGFFRFAYPLFPRAADFFSPYLGVLAVIGILYGALLAWAQTDMKKVVAYSSVSHLGFCVLGLVALSEVSLTGSVYQMLSHGLSTSGLFLIVGALYERRHTHETAEFQGLSSQVPILAFSFMIFSLGSVALPLTSGFVAEFMILTGSFAAWPALTTPAVLAVVFGAVYMLTLYLQTMFGPYNGNKNAGLLDLNAREIVTVVPLLVLIFVMGIFSQPFIRVIEPSVKTFVTTLENRAAALNENEFGTSPSGTPAAGREARVVRNAGERSMRLARAEERPVTSAAREM